MREVPLQPALIGEIDKTTDGFQDPAFVLNRIVPVHRWVPWIAGYSQAFASDAIGKFTRGPGHVVLDPFAGVGTTLVEADGVGHQAVGFEINPYAAFVATVKLNAHRLNTGVLRDAICRLRRYGEHSETNGILPEFKPPAGFKSRSPFFSPMVLQKVLLVLDFIELERRAREDIANVIRLALGATMVGYSNYSYEPSLSRKVSAGKREVTDFPVIEGLCAKLQEIAEDADWYRENRAGGTRRDGVVYRASFLEDYRAMEHQSVDLIVTSPPYMNNYHYNRNTRPHLYWLGFCDSPKDLKLLEHQNFGTYWQTARDLGTVELDSAIKSKEIHDTVAAIREQNPDKGVYGGNGWANYATAYLNDCVRFLQGVRWVLRDNGTALIVLGNSILQGVPVPTDRFMAAIASDCGLDVREISTPRETRVGNSIVDSGARTRQSSESVQLYESVIEVRQPG